MMSARQPAELHEIFRQAFNNGDVETVLALYESGATLLVNGEPVTGIERIRATIETWLAPRGRMRLETRAVIESSIGLALLHGAWAVETTDDNTAMPSSGMSIEVARRQTDGTWRFVIDCPHTQA
jgi:uncharacterized protein (TIGR02246 family)